VRRLRVPGRDPFLFPGENPEVFFSFQFKIQRNFIKGAWRITPDHIKRPRKP
jgi:hypothetical protein